MVWGNAKKEHQSLNQHIHKEVDKWFDFFMNFKKINSEDTMSGRKLKHAHYMVGPLVEHIASTIYAHIIDQ